VPRITLERGPVVAERGELATTVWTRAKGLLGRTGMAEGEGLWIQPTSSIHMWFMRFPIDAVFVGRAEPDGARVVVSVHERLPAWRGLVPLVRGAHGVLELPAGTIEATATAVGDRILIG